MAPHAWLLLSWPQPLRSSLSAAQRPHLELHEPPHPQPLPLADQFGPPLLLPPDERPLTDSLGQPQLPLPHLKPLETQLPRTLEAA